MPCHPRNPRLINFLIVLAHFLGSPRCSMSVGTNFLTTVRHSLAIARHSAVIVHRFLVTMTSYGTDVSYYGAI